MTLWGRCLCIKRKIRCKEFVQKEGNSSALWNNSCSSNSAGSNYWTFRESAETATKRNSGLLSGLAELSRCCGGCTIYTHGLRWVWRNRMDNSVTLENQGEARWARPRCNKYPGELERCSSALRGKDERKKWFWGGSWAAVEERGGLQTVQAQSEHLDHGQSWELERESHALCTEMQWNAVHSHTGLMAKVA